MYQYPCSYIKTVWTKNTDAECGIVHIRDKGTVPMKLYSIFILVSGNLGVSEQDVESLVEKLKENPFVSLQNEFSTYFRIDKHVKTSPAFKYIEPVQVKLPVDSDGKISAFQYIPIISTVDAILSDRSFSPAPITASDLIKDIKDGSAWRENEYFRNNPDALAGLLYSDALELCNPLGPRKGFHKIVNVYFTLAEIPKHLRSKTENWFLVMMVNEHDLKKNRDVVYKTLVDDLKRLEEGVLVGSRVIQMGIIAHLGDNLESHTVGGFSCCFSSKDICRVCHLQHQELPSISGIPSARKWTQDEYDNAVRSIGQGERSLQPEFGLSGGCVFNVLDSFSSVGQFPFDCMHDFMEGLAAMDAQAGLLTLIDEQNFTVHEYNALLADLQLGDYEIGDRPPPVRAQSDRLQGKAMAVALHIRVMPFLLHRLMKDYDHESIALELLIMIHQLNEYIMADAFNPADIMDFEELLVKYFAKRKECSEKFTAFQKLKPKFHYVEHYAEQIEQFGPFCGVWTARCESKHRDYVNFSESSKNFINLLKTLAVKNQKKMASR